MPWCDHCDAYRAPNALNPDGTCATCEQPVDTADLKVDAGDGGSARPPWHFWTMVAALVAYLGWRLVQGVAWVVHHI